MLPLRVLKGNRLLLACSRWISGYIERDQWLEDFADLNLKKREKLFPQSHRVRDFESMNPLLIEADEDLPDTFGEISQFSQLHNLDERLLTNLQRLGFVDMTPVQRYAIPALLSGSDVLASAETGSGKTHAFLVPLVHSIISRYPEEMMRHLKEMNGKYQCPLGLIVTPSNALALQIQNECDKLLFGTPTRAMATGATDISQTMKRLADGCHILVGTPSRVLELVQRGCLKLEFCRHLVIDEVDSFTDVNGILGSYLRMLVNAPQIGLPNSANRRTMLCSATITRSDETICRGILSSNYIRLSPDPEFGKPVPSSISQSFIWTGSANDDEKMDLLIDLLNKLGSRDKILIYCKYSKCKTLEKVLMQNGFVPSKIVKGFLSTRSELGTDVKDRNIIISSLSSAFGLDFIDVKYVIIMDMPSHISMYVHQIGRGGRMGEKAHAVSFFGDKDLKLADDLMILLESCGSPIPDFLSQLYVNDDL